MSKIVAYVRLSEEDKVKEENSASILNQISFIKEYATNNDLSIDDIYVDDGFSGINFERPEFNRLKSDIEKNNISVLITKDISRLGREYLDTAYMISTYFNKYNVRYIAINDNYDSFNKNYSSDLMLKFKSVMNDRVVKDASVKVTLAKRKKTELGNYMGFIAPYGYKRVKVNGVNTIEIDKKPAEIVKRIFNELAQGKSRKEISDNLNKDKILSPMIYLKMTPSNGKHYDNVWTDRIVYTIIKNIAYTGSIYERKSFKKNYKDKKRTFIKPADRVILENRHPAIISKELFDRANSNIRKTKTNSFTNEYIGCFNNLVVCGECGNIMKYTQVARRGRTEAYLNCHRVRKGIKCSSKTIRENKLKKIILDIINEEIKNKVDKDYVINKQTKKIIYNNKDNKKKRNIEINIKLKEDKIKSLYLEKTKGLITLEQFLELKEIENKEKVEYENELKRLKEKKDSIIQKENLSNLYNEFMTNIANSDDYISKFIKQIIIFKNGRIMITFRFPNIEKKEIIIY